MDDREMYGVLGVRGAVYDFCMDICRGLAPRFQEIDAVAEYNQLKVVQAMQAERVSEAHLYGTTGYGYNDIGRDALEAVYARVFHTEDALVRSQLVCGTHALAIALQANLLPGDELLSPVGKPYDTLEEVIGIRPSIGSLREYGVTYREVGLKEDGSFDYEAIRQAIRPRTRMVEIQRSKGYSSRQSFSPQEIGGLIHFLKEEKEDLICMVDNCYGEFVLREEPSDYGADLVVGSLIKNPGGGLAPVGGYIAGKKPYIDRCAVRLTSPGLGREVGPSLSANRDLFYGLFLAPTVTASAEKAAVFAATVFEKLGFPCHPKAGERRNDIIQAVTFGSPEALSAFCRGIQAAAPIDSFVRPEASEMPGYDAKVIMAAGAFVQGSSIELSADGPMKPPYNAYFQGGLTFPHAKFGIMRALEELCRAGVVEEAQCIVQ